MAKNTLDWIAIVLVIIGALNWGLVATGFNLVESIFSAGTFITTLIYALVGLSGIWMVFRAAK